MNRGELQSGISRPKWQQRWWLKSRPILPTVSYSDCGQRQYGAIFEVYTPWWAKPLDTLHAAIFGSTKLKKE